MDIDSEIEKVMAELASSDSDVIRIIEDIIEVLRITRILKREFLSETVWDKLKERHDLRKKLTELKMLRLKTRRYNRKAQHLAELMSLENEDILSKLKS